MKIHSYILALALAALSWTGCELDKIVDPNNPSVLGIAENASVAQLNNLVAASLSQMRMRLNTYHDVVGVVGRDIYRFSGSDPRWVAELLNSVLDNNAFYTTRPWGERYRTVKNCNLLIASVQNTNAVTEEEMQGYLGFAKTLQAHELLLVLNMQNENGIRINVVDPDALGPIVSKEEALTFLAGLLEEGKGHLEQAGSAFAFPLTSGFAGFDDPAGFIKLNRALAARVAAYRKLFPEVLTHLSESFFDLDADLDLGAYHVFTTGPGDQLNPLFLPLGNTGENRLAHPEWVGNAAAGDLRLAKVAQRDEPVSASGLTSEYDAFLFPTNTSPICIIRNEELILLYAEAQIQADDAVEAVKALDVVRTTHGLPAYGGPTDKDALIDEMLLQRKYSLWYEGHRWVDMRRYDKLNELPIDRVGDFVHVNFPIPRDDDF